MTRYTPLWLQPGSYAASVDRRLIGALWPTAAVKGCAVSASSGMNLNVAAGTVVVPTGNTTGSMLCTSDAVEVVTVAAAPGAGSNRFDWVVCQARGNDIDGGTNNDFIFTTVTGTAAASPSPPAVPANAVALAQVFVAGGSASIVAGNLVDMRPTPLSPPRGLLGSSASATQTDIVGATLTQIAGLSVTVNVGVGRLLRASFQAGQAQSSGTAGGIYFRIAEDGDQATLTAARGYYTGVTTAGTFPAPGFMTAPFAPPAGQHVYTVWGAAPAGATISLFGSNYTHRLMIEDLGG